MGSDTWSTDQVGLPVSSYLKSCVCGDDEGMRDNPGVNLRRRSLEEERILKNLRSKWAYLAQYQDHEEKEDSVRGGE